MTVRELPPAEWGALATLPGAGLEDLWARLPATTRVIVVEDAGRIVACVSAMLMLHAEGAWIAPEYRKHPGVWRKLLRRLHAVADEFGCHGAWAAAIDEPMRRVLRTLHARRLPGEHYLVPKENSSCLHS